MTGTAVEAVTVTTPLVVVHSVDASGSREVTRVRVLSEHALLPAAHVRAL
ncbi:MAG: hypothetical protein VW552_07900 [Ilumatobacter sp.]